MGSAVHHRHRFGAGARFGNDGAPPHRGDAVASKAYLHEGGVERRIAGCRLQAERIMTALFDSDLVVREVTLLETRRNPISFEGRFASRSPPCGGGERQAERLRIARRVCGETEDCEKDKKRGSGGI